MAWNPDVIFVDFNGMELIKQHYAENPDYYNQLKAVQEGKVYSQISFRSVPLIWIWHWLIHIMQVLYCILRNLRILIRKKKQMKSLKSYLDRSFMIR